MTSGGDQDIVHGRHERPARGVWVGQRWRVMLLAACIGAASIIVPPLIVKEHQQPPVSPVTTSDPSAAARAAAATISPTTSRPAAVVTPLSVQAEDPGNLMSPPASVVPCETCDGGFRVRYIGGAGQVVVRATLPAAGWIHVTVIYECHGSRAFKISINGAPALVRTVSGPDWDTPQTFSFDASFPAGTVLLSFYNDDSPAPDLDRVVLG